MPTGPTRFLRGAALLSILAALGCGERENTPTCTPKSGAVGAPVLLSSKLVRPMGAFVVPARCGEASSQAQALGGASGELVDGSAVRGLVRALTFPVLPVFDSAGNFLVEPRILRVDETGAVSEVYRFPEPPSAFSTGFTSVYQTGSGEAQVPRGLLLSVVESANGEVFVANSVTGEIFKLAGGVRSTVATGLEGLSGMAFDPAGNLFVASTAVFDTGSPSRLVAPPEIHRIAPDGTRTRFYAFAADADRYATGFSRCTADRCVPVGLVTDLVFDGSGNLLVATNFARTIIRLDANGTAHDHHGPVAGVTGLAFGPEGDLYFTRSPLLGQDDSILSGPKIEKLDRLGNVQTLWEGPKSDAYRTGFYSQIEGGLYPLDAVFNLNLDAQGNLYLEDSLAGTFSLLPRAE